MGRLGYCTCPGRGRAKVRSPAHSLSRLARITESDPRGYFHPTRRCQCPSALLSIVYHGLTEAIPIPQTKLQNVRIVKRCGGYRQIRPTGLRSESTRRCVGAERRIAGDTQGPRAEARGRPRCEQEGHGCEPGACNLYAAMALTQDCSAAGVRGQAVEFAGLSTGPRSSGQVRGDVAGHQ